MIKTRCDFHYFPTILEKLESKFRHDVKRMSKGAMRLGLSIADGDRQLLNMMASSSRVLIEARYIRVSAKTWPTIEALDRICTALRLNVGTLLHKNGVMVRI